MKEIEKENRELDGERKFIAKEENKVVLKGKRSEWIQNSQHSFARYCSVIAES